jgi:hypothetical protein
MWFRKVRRLRATVASSGLAGTDLLLMAASLNTVASGSPESWLKEDGAGRRS